MDKEEKTLGERLEQLLEKVTAAEDFYKVKLTKSFTDQYSNGHTLSERQVQLLEEWERQYGDEQMALLEKWQEEYAASDSMQARMRLAIKYYEGMTYFHAVRSKYTAWHADPSNEGKVWIPTQSTFMKMTQNPYFERYREEVSSSPKFSAGDWVTGRASTRNSGVLLMIVKQTEKVQAFKGGKEYLALRIAQPLYSKTWVSKRGINADGITCRVDERDIKKFKVKKGKRA